RVSELESQLSQLQDDLKKTKDQLNASESSKRQAQQEAEESKKQLMDMSSKVEECQQQLMELTSSDDTRVEELTKISHDRDRAWQSELEAVQRQHSMDSAALGTAMNEIQRLKNQLQIVAESEATQINHAESAHEELQRLRMELNETLSLVERIKSEMNDCRHSEAEAMEAAREAQQQLEAIALELEQSKAQAKSLEASGDSSATAMEVTVDQDATNQLKGEVKSLKYEVGQLKAALEASEARYQVEYIQSTLEIRSAYEQAEKTKQESVEREADLEAELEKAKANIDKLKATLMDKETELLNISNKNEGLRSKMEEENQSSEKESELAMQLKKLEHDFTLLKAALLEKETQVKGLAEKNDMLKIEIERGEAERSRANDEAAAIADTAKAGEREALMKLGSVTEEADKSSRRVARVTEQLDAAQAANTEMEAELRRLKVQADQWRKAAEAAASMLSSTGNNNNGKFVERTGSLDSGMNNYNTIAGTMGSPFSEDMDDESPKKKNGNVLKKFGVLWKKGQK
ncbi:unnamed protein product, partial [Linum tenue]